MKQLHKCSNNLLLNMIKVKYLTNNTIESDEFYLSLNNLNKKYDNGCITLKVMLYLYIILTASGLSTNTYVITTDDIKDKLSINNITYFKASLDYISCFNYKLDNVFFTTVFKEQKCIGISIITKGQTVSAQ